MNDGRARLDQKPPMNFASSQSILLLDESSVVFHRVSAIAVNDCVVTVIQPTLAS